MSASTNPKVQGGVSKAPAGRVMVIEFDTNGDSIVDGTTIVGANLKWTYTPVGLPYGSVTVSARTKDTAPNGQTLYSGWTNFTFTLQTGVDSQAPTEQQDHQEDIEDAESQANESKNAADSTLSSAIEAANSAQDTSNTAAQNAFDQSVLTASNAYSLALSNAAADYQTALAAFSGNSSNFEFQPLEWPASPQVDRLTLPADGQLPSRLLNGRIDPRAASHYQ